MIIFGNQSITAQTRSSRMAGPQRRARLKVDSDSGLDSDSAEIHGCFAGLAARPGGRGALDHDVVSNREML